MAMIFHIAPKEKWTKSRSKGQYTEESLQSEGFIHCSTAEQVVDTANRHYKGQDGLVLLSIDTSDIVSVIAYEKEDNHFGKGRSLLYLDGRGAWEPPENWRGGPPNTSLPEGFH